MDRLREMEVFVAVAAEGGLAKAGRRLGLSPPVVTRTLAALEARLDARLFNRTTRRLSLTDAGVRFLASAQRLLADIDHAEKDAGGEAGTPRGHLSITASATFGRSVMTTIIRDFMVAQPRVTVSALFLDRVVDLVDEAIDVAVRIGDLPDSTLVARRVGTVRRLLVASPDYVARHGAPTAPADLHDHGIIAITGLMPDGVWRHVEAGRPRSITLAPRLTFNDAVAALACAEAGQGITIALSYMVAEALRRGRLLPVLEGCAPAETPVHLVLASGRHPSPASRAFVDFAAPRIAAALDDQSPPRSATGV